MDYKSGDILPYTGKHEETLLVLRDGDTMDDPSSTKRIIRGPADIHLTRYADGGLDAVIVNTMTEEV